MKIGKYDVQILEKVDTSDIRKELMNGNEMLIKPFSEWNKFSWGEQRTLMHETGTFVCPTEELIDHLDKLIGEEKAIEVCAGNGWIGRELDIPTTDSRIQEDKVVRDIYLNMHQIPIKYPRYIQKMEANKAVDIYKPHTVIACYPAFKWDGEKGSDYGVDFKKLLKKVKRLIIVGNDNIHAGFDLFNLPHEEYHVDGMLTRNTEREKDKIYIWNN